MGGGSSHDRRKLERAAERLLAKKEPKADNYQRIDEAESPEPILPVPTTSKSPWVEMYEFCNRPIPLLFIAVLLGIMGVYYFTPLLLLCEVVFVYDFYKFGRDRQKKWSILQFALFVGVTALLLFGAHYLVGRAQSSTANQNNFPAPTPSQKEELAMQCEPTFLPIGIAPHSDAAILLLSSESNFIDQLNQKNEYLYWPSRDVATVPNDASKAAYQCKVASLEGPVEEVLITITVIKSKGSISFPIRFPLLDKSQAPFYVVAQCSDITGFIPPDTVTFSVSGERSRRDGPLLGESPIEKRAHLFFPSGIKWRESPNCT